MSTEVLGERHSQLKALADELATLKITPEINYTTQGIEALSNALVQARGYSSRAAEIHSRSIRFVAQARVAFGLIKDQHQDAYDRVVVSESHKYGDRSWEERGSLYRVKCLYTLTELRFGQATFDQCEAYLLEIRTMAMSLYQARGDLEAIAGVMRMGEAVGELGRKL